ncbi:MAG TPA: ABC transporter substrate-binding protein [candidate division Zixibacteria bacterium]|nr:ABC transporter substrate-binding protein [candidate division Zixibacteria bacterium]
MSERRCFSFAWSAIVFTTVLACAAAARAAAPLQKVVFVFAGFNERSGFLFTAKDMRFFDEQGIDAQIVQVRSGQVAVSALAANEAQFYSVSATGASLGAMAGGLDLNFIAGIVNKLDGDVVVAPRIASPSDLKGKTLGVQSIGGGVWTFTMLALDHWGLTPDRDKIQFRVVGDQAVLAQALITGSIDGCYLGYTFSKVAQRQGFRVLQDLAKVDIPYQGIGIVARKSYIEQSPDTAARALRAIAKSVAFFLDPANKPRVVEILMKWLRLARVDDAVAGYDAMQSLYSRRIFPTVDGIRNTVRILGRIDPKFSRLKAENLVDERIVRRLEAEGLFR